MTIVKNARSQLLTLGYLLSDCLSRADKQAAEKILERPFVGVSIDSRTVGQGEIFFAVKGKNLDGHAFVQGALSAGAVVVIVQEGYREVRDARMWKNGMKLLKFFQT